MNVTLPIYVERQTQEDGRPRHRVRPLFHDEPKQADEQLGRALGRLAADLRELLQELGKHRRHERLAVWTFCPEIEHHRFDFTLELKSGRFKCCFLVAAFAALGRRIAMSPNVPDFWFEILPGEDLEQRAGEALTDHFRKQEREEEGSFVSPDRLSIQGRAWVTTVELDVEPNQVIEDPEKVLYALLGDDEVLDGETELRRVGRCLDRLYPDGLERVLCREAEVAELSKLLTADDRRPVLLVGPRLVGKTALLHEYVYQACGKRDGKHRFDNNVWLVSPQRLISGMSFVGQWENRLLAIVKEIRKRDHILYFDDLLGLYQAGQSRDSKLCVADVLRPYIERRTLRIVGEMTPEAVRVLRERDRGFADLFHVIPIRPPTDAENLQILIASVRNLEDRHRVDFDLDVLPTAIELQRRHNRSASFPGKATTFLERLAVKARKVTRQMVLDEFHAQSGLSLTLLDSKARLDRAEVVRTLSEAVIGQPGAVEAAADVIAIAKARLNDPDRPLAAFLFLGPTGVGKTQSAKALAKHLFGDADRLVRFDMNEFVDPGSASRLVGTFDQPEGLLTAAVRRQPFAVVLLDEIEKAHAEVHDLLLQVLGEGRLTDALGRVVDFSNCIVLLTSNLGVREVSGRFGFRRSAAEDRAAYVRAAERFFRPEFFNRLDRVVPFERLERDDVARIARGLIRDVLGREGLVRRKCVLHVEPAAMDRVVEVGHDPLLGARALKRAIEKHLTRPVAQRLAAGLPETVTVISLYAGGDFVRTHVQALEETPRQPSLAERVNLDDERGLLRRIETTLRRIEEQFAPLRPPTEITAQTLRPEYDRWFAIQERLRTVRQLSAAIEEEAEREDRKERAGTAYPVNVMDRATNLSGSLATRNWYRGHGTSPVRHNYLAELAAAQDIHAYLNELALRALPIDQRRERLSELVHQVALVHLVAEACATSAPEQVLLSVRPLHATSVPCAGPLIIALERAFTESLGLEFLRVEEDPTADLQREEYAAILHGPHAMALSRLEAGTHLFCLEREGLLPVQVCVRPLEPGRNAVEVLVREKEARACRLAALSAGDSEMGDGVLLLPPVIRIYEQRGVVLDLRSGEVVKQSTGRERAVGSTPPIPSAGVLADFILAALALPDEVTERSVLS